MDAEHPSRRRRPFVYLAIAGTAIVSVVAVIIYLLDKKAELAEIGGWPPWKLHLAVGGFTVAVLWVMAYMAWRECGAMVDGASQVSAAKWLRIAQSNGSYVRMAILNSSAGWTEQQAREQFHGWRLLTDHVLKAFFDAAIADTFDGPLFPRRQLPAGASWKAFLVALMDDRMDNLNDIILRFKEGRLRANADGESLANIITRVPTPPASGTAPPPTSTGGASHP
jgi:hypothetical protein